jgi:hypothetical protein
LKHKLVIPAAIAALGLVTAAPVAHAATVKQVRQADLITALNDVRSAGHYEFLAEGVHVKTDNATSQAKVALYFPVTDAFPTSGGVEWYGTSPAPGAQLVFDADNVTGNGNDYNILVGESIYGANWWLTNGSSATAKAADPSGAENGGNGSEWFGTLAQWKAALPTAKVLAGGFSLGSGIQGEGVVRAVNLGETSYVFTDTPAVVTKDVTGSVEGKVQGKARKLKLTLTADKLAAGTTQGKALEWKIVVDGSTAASFSQNAGEVTKLSYRFPKNTGTHKVQVFKNGEKVETFKVKTTKK